MLRSPDVDKAATDFTFEPSRTAKLGREVRPVLSTTNSKKVMFVAVLEGNPLQMKLGHNN